MAANAHRWSPLYLPFRPLARAAAHGRPLLHDLDKSEAGHMVNVFNADGHAGMTNGELARIFGCTRRSIERYWAGGVTVAMGEDMAVAVDRHPMELWGWDYENLLVATDYRGKVRHAVASGGAVA